MEQGAQEEIDGKLTVGLGSLWLYNVADGKCD